MDEDTAHALQFPQFRALPDTVRDRDHGNSNRRQDCSRCGTKRGERMPEIQVDGGCRPELIDGFLRRTASLRSGPGRHPMVPSC